MFKLGKIYLAYSDERLQPAFLQMPRNTLPLKQITQQANVSGEHKHENSGLTKHALVPVHKHDKAKTNRVFRQKLLSKLSLSFPLGLHVY